MFPQAALCPGDLPPKWLLGVGALLSLVLKLALFPLKDEIDRGWELRSINLALDPYDSAVVENLTTKPKSE